MTIKKGTDWAGAYSRFTFDETKAYYAMLKEKSKAVLDDDFNLMQDIQLTLLRRLAFETFGDGSPNAGFLVVGTGANNDFTVTGGNGSADGAQSMYVSGLRVPLLANTTYNGQPIPQTTLSTPSGPRSDTVYLDVYFAEVGPTQDPLIVDPTLGVETSRRLHLVYQVRVAEGSGGAPASYVDGNGQPHYTAAIATLNRTASAAITAGMVTDLRADLKVSRVVEQAGSIHMSAVAGNDPGCVSCNGAALSRTVYSRLFARIGTTFGDGDGATTFNVPNYNGRTPVGMGLGAGLTSRVLGQTFGEEAHTLLDGEMTRHSHFTVIDATDGDASALTSTTSIVRRVNAGVTGDYNLLSDLGSPTIGLTSEAGSGAAFNIVQPSIVVNFQIRY